MMTTKQIEKQSIEEAEGVGKLGTYASLALHHAVMGGGEPTREIADALHGTWLGHPLHPMLTDITIGAWSMGVVFDSIGAVTDSDQAREMGDKLAIAGTIAAVPTALSGLADFSTFPDWSANTATLHGAMNIVGVGLYAWSIRERRRGYHGRGAIISGVAFGLACVSGWLGGRMVYKQKVGVNHGEPFEKPERWTTVLESSKLHDGKPRRVDFDKKGVLLYRKGDAIYAIGSVCSHAGGPLEEGKIKENCVECPWHGSVFDMQDGSIVHGPATQPQTAFDVRERDGEIQIKLRKDG
jgi:nitrite reductase/ring-hydroxylating ferredoxin subunit/uncharacterized membrane protein